MFVLYQIFYF